MYYHVIDSELLCKKQPKYWLLVDSEEDPEASGFLSSRKQSYPTVEHDKFMKKAKMLEQMQYEFLRMLSLQDTKEDNCLHIVRI